MLLSLIFLIFLFLFYCWAESENDLSISKIQNLARKSDKSLSNILTTLEKKWKNFQFIIHLMMISFFTFNISSIANIPNWYDFSIIWTILVLFHSSFHDRYIMWKLSGKFWLLERRLDFNPYWWDNLWWILFPKEPNKSTFLGKVSVFTRLFLIIILTLLLIF